MSVHNKGGIGLGPSNNRQVIYKFLCLTTAGVITRCNFTDIPIPQEVISRTNAISAAKRQPKNLNFGDREINTKTGIFKHNPGFSVVDREIKQELQPQEQEPQ